MNTWSTKSRWLGYVAGCAAIILSLGQTCALPFSPFEPPLVDIELVNYTAYDVDPYIFIHPDSGVPLDVLFQPENELIVDPLLAPEEVAVYTFDCLDVGTIGSDFALMYLSPFEVIESDNGPYVDKGIDFFCGDIVSFIFIDDGVDFFTEVEVNGELITGW